MSSKSYSESDERKLLLDRFKLRPYQRWSILEPIPTGGLASSATVGSLGNGGVPPDMEHAPETTMFVSTLSRPWEKLVTMDGHTVGVDCSEQSADNISKQVKDEDYYSNYEVTDKSDSNQQEISFNLSNYDQVMSDKARQYSGKMETPKRSTVGRLSDDDAPPTVRQLLHRLDELVLGRNNHSTQDKKGDNSDTSMDSIDEDDKFDLSQLAHENDRKQQEMLASLQDDMLSAAMLDLHGEEDMQLLPPPSPQVLRGMLSSPSPISATSHITSPPYNYPSQPYGGEHSYKPSPSSNLGTSPMSNLMSNMPKTSNFPISSYATSSPIKERRSPTKNKDINTSSPIKERRSPTKNKDINTSSPIKESKSPRKDKFASNTLSPVRLTSSKQYRLSASPVRSPPRPDKITETSYNENSCASSLDEGSQDDDEKQDIVEDNEDSLDDSLDDSLIPPTQTGSSTLSKLRALSRKELSAKFVNILGRGIVLKQHFQNKNGGGTQCKQVIMWAVGPTFEGIFCAPTKQTVVEDDGNHEDSSLTDFGLFIPPVGVKVRGNKKIFITWGEISTILSGHAVILPLEGKHHLLFSLRTDQESYDFEASSSTSQVVLVSGLAAVVAEYKWYVANVLGVDSKTHTLNKKALTKETEKRDGEGVDIESTKAKEEEKEEKDYLKSLQRGRYNIDKNKMSGRAQSTPPPKISSNVTEMKASQKEHLTPMKRNNDPSSYTSPTVEGDGSKQPVNMFSPVESTSFRRESSYSPKEELREEGVFDDSIEEEEEEQEEDEEEEDEEEEEQDEDEEEEEDDDEEEEEEDDGEDEEEEEVKVKEAPLRRSTRIVNRIINGSLSQLNDSSEDEDYTKSEDSEHSSDENSSENSSREDGVSEELRELEIEQRLYEERKLEVENKSSLSTSPGNSESLSSYSQAEMEAATQFKMASRQAAERLMKLGKMLQDKGLVDEAMATYSEAADLYKSFGDDGKSYKLWDSVAEEAVREHLEEKKVEVVEEKDVKVEKSSEDDENVKSYEQFIEEMKIKKQDQIDEDEEEEEREESEKVEELCLQAMEKFLGFRNVAGSLAVSVSTAASTLNKLPRPHLLMLYEAFIGPSSNNSSNLDMNHLSYAIGFKAMTQPDGVAAKALQNLFKSNKEMPSNDHQEDPSTEYMDRWLQDTIHQQDNDEESGSDDDYDEPSIRRSARILHKIVDGSLNQSRDTNYEEEDNDEDYMPPDESSEESEDSGDYVNESDEVEDVESEANSSFESPSKNTSGIEYVRAHREGTQVSPVQEAQEDERAEVFEFNTWQKRHASRDAIIKQMYDRKLKKEQEEEMNNASTAASLRARHHIKSTSKQQSHTANNRVLYPKKIAQERDDQETRREVKKFVMTQDEYGVFTDTQFREEESEQDIEEEEDEEKSDEEADEVEDDEEEENGEGQSDKSRSSLGSVGARVLGSRGYKILSALRKGTKEPNKYNADSLHYMYDVEPNNTKRESKRESFRAAKKANMPNKSSSSNQRPAALPVSASMSSVGLGVATAKEHEIMKSNMKDRLNRRRSYDNNETLASKKQTVQDTEKENAHVKRKSSTWWPRSTLKSESSSKKAVTSRVDWEMEKATMLRDLNERERNLVLTFSDRNNFRAAVTALKKMRKETRGVVV